MNSKMYIYKVFVTGRGFDLERDISSYNNSVIFSTDKRINTSKRWRQCWLDVFSFVQNKSPEWLITDIDVKFKFIESFEFPSYEEVFNEQ